MEKLTWYEIKGFIKSCEGKNLKYLGISPKSSTIDPSNKEKKKRENQVVQYETMNEKKNWQQTMSEKNKLVPNND